MWTDQIVFFKKIIRVLILPVFKSRVLFWNLWTVMSSRCLTGPTIAHLWMSWDLTADKLRIQSKLIKQVWSQVKNSKDKQEVNCICKHGFGSWFCNSVVLGIWEFWEKGPFLLCLFPECTCLHERRWKPSNYQPDLVKHTFVRKKRG